MDSGQNRLIALNYDGHDNDDDQKNNNHASVSGFNDLLSKK